MCSDHANVSANQRGVGWEGVGRCGAGLLPVAGVAGGGELNKDVSRPDRGGETGGEVEVGEGERHAWKVIKAA